MNKFAKLLASSFAAAAIFNAVPAAAQFQVYEDYEPAEEVVEMTFVKVDEGQFETYLEGLASTWVAANQIQKDLGYITDFKIFGVPYGDNSVNLVLMITFPSDEMLAPSKERYLAFLEAYGEANIEQGNTTVLELYNNIREIQGTYLMREVNLLEN
ncbi:MAG: hypothetical protein ABJP48_12175 [Erythrobacter sp.]